jgi:very-short-patch-repair endonuclease
VRRFNREYDAVALGRMVSRAREMRRRPTESEAHLWSHLRRARLGVRFRRQVILGPFIVDFLAPSARLVVEVDGGVHLSRQNADRRRDEALAALGYCVVRVSVDEVMTDVGSVLRVLRGHLG